MNKFIHILLILVFAISLSACSNPNNTIQQDISKDSVDTDKSEISKSESILINYKGIENLDLDKYVNGLIRSNGNFNELLSIFPSKPSRESERDLDSERTGRSIEKKAHFNNLEINGLNFSSSIHYLDHIDLKSKSITVHFSLEENDNEIIPFEYQEIIFLNTLESYFTEIKEKPGQNGFTSFSGQDERLNGTVLIGPDKSVTLYIGHIPKYHEN